MREAPLPFAGSRAVTWLFAAGLVAIPFDAVYGVRALGELGYELSFPFFGLAIAGAAFLSLTGRLPTARESLVLRVACGAMALIAVSYLANFSEINDAVFRGRSGIHKFATSLLVLGYGLALAWLAEHLDARQASALVARFVAWSAIVATLYLCFEYAGKQGLLGPIYDRIDQVVHSRQADIINPWDGSLNERVLYGWDERLRSVSFEPPAFGNYAGLAWPWVWYAAVTAARERRLRTWMLLIAFTLAILFAANRTGLLIFGTSVVSIGLLAAVYARGRPNSEALAAARVLLPIAGLIAAVGAGVWALASVESIVQQVTRDGSVSNVTRLGFQLATFEMFSAHPVFGVGLGQSGLRVVEHLPDWIFRSPEVLPMITYPDAPWPTTYSLHARIAAELGIVGLLSWIGLWLVLIWKLALQARVAAAAGGPRWSWHYPIILNCAGVLVSGLTTDTFRTPMIWIALGLGCAALRQRARQDAPVTPAQTPVQALAEPR